MYVTDRGPKINKLLNVVSRIPIVCDVCLNLMCLNKSRENCHRSNIEIRSHLNTTLKLFTASPPNSHTSKYRLQHHHHHFTNINNCTVHWYVSPHVQLGNAHKANRHAGGQINNYNANTSRSTNHAERWSADIILITLILPLFATLHRPGCPWCLKLNYVRHLVYVCPSGIAIWRVC